MFNKKLVKNILIFFFLIIAVVVIMNFSDHNFKRSVQACIAVSQLDNNVKFNSIEKPQNFVKKK